MLNSYGKHRPYSQILDSVVDAWNKPSVFNGMPETKEKIIFYNKIYTRKTFFFNYLLVIVGENSLDCYVSIRKKSNRNKHSSLLVLNIGDIEIFFNIDFGLRLELFFFVADVRTK